MLLTVIISHLSSYISHTHIPIFIQLYLIFYVSIYMELRGDGFYLLL